MSSLDNILAKSILYGGTTLLAHTQHVVLCTQKMVQCFEYDLDSNLALKGAVLHDLGKAHPKFQERIKGKSKESLLTEFEEEGYIHRHEISSLAFLPCFSKDEWPTLIDMVVAHHKPIESPNSEGKGILDLKTRYRDWKQTHLNGWSDWQQYGIEIIQSFGLECADEISIEDAEEALKFVVDYCDAKKNGWSPYRGLLKSADHFASALIERTEENLNHTFEVPDLSFYRDKQRKSDLYPLSKISADNRRSHTIVVAPTGA